MRIGRFAYALTHTFTKKGNRLYRYYVNAQAMKEGWDTCQTTSFPAGEIESFVIENISKVAKDRGLQQAILKESNSTGQQIQQEEPLSVMADFHLCWEQIVPRERTRLMELLIEKILVDAEAGKLSIQFRPSGIKTLLNENK